MLAIGEFSRLTHLSIRTLRRYHEAGLLEPELVDASSGYRYYTVDQIPTAQVIRRLREVDVARAKYWLGVGAQPSDTVWRLLSLVSFDAEGF